MRNTTATQCTNRRRQRWIEQLGELLHFFGLWAVDSGLWTRSGSRLAAAVMWIGSAAPFDLTVGQLEKKGRK